MHFTITKIGLIPQQSSLSFSLFKKSFLAFFIFCFYKKNTLFFVKAVLTQTRADDSACLLFIYLIFSSDLSLSLFLSINLSIYLFLFPSPFYIPSPFLDYPSLSLSYPAYSLTLLISYPNSLSLFLTNSLLPTLFSLSHARTLSHSAPTSLSTSSLSSLFPTGLSIP